MTSIRRIVYILATCTILTLGGCTSQQWAEIGRELSAPDKPITERDVSRALRQALIQGTDRGTAELSRDGGYLNNPRLRIPFPPEIRRVETALRDVGMNSLVDQFITSLNRGAELAAKEAQPIFMSAIREMTIQDAFAILRGEDDEATQYLRRSTSVELTKSFKPIISRALNRSDATRYYGDIARNYNSIPFVEPITVDLAGFVTDRAIDGLFAKIAEEERKIRDNPRARTTELMRRVFGLDEA